MSSALEIARELLVRTRNISAALDSIVLPHQKILALRGELKKEPFTEHGRTTTALSSELDSIEGLLAKGLANDACSSLAIYERRVTTMLPALRSLAGVKRGMRATGASVRDLEDIEDRILADDLHGAELMMCSVRPASSPVASPKATPPSRDVVPCVLCGLPGRADLGFCPFCGWEKDAPVGECPECGGTVLLKFRACPSCGKGLASRTGDGRIVLSPLIHG